MCSDGWCCDLNVFSPGRVEEMDSVETEACKFEHRRATSGAARISMECVQLEVHGLQAKLQFWTA